MVLVIGCCKCSLCPQKFMGGYVQPHIVIVWEIKIEERGRGGWHDFSGGRRCKYHLSAERLPIKNFKLQKYWRRV